MSSIGDTNAQCSLQLFNKCCYYVTFYWEFIVCTLLIKQIKKTKWLQKAGVSDHIIRHHSVLRWRKQIQNFKVKLSCWTNSPACDSDAFSKRLAATNFKDAHHLHWKYKIQIWTNTYRVLKQFIGRDLLK